MTTKRIRGFIRDPASGVGEVAASVAIKLHNGGSTVTSDGTDGNGLFEIDADTVGYPGPVYAESTVGATTKVRSGEVWGQIGGLVWAGDIPDALSALGIGVVAGVSSELACSADGLSMDIAVTPGIAILKDGLPYVREGAATLTIGTADASNPRIDRIILRLTREGQTDQGKIVLRVLAGTAAASPAAPTLTQTSATWDLSLAQVLVGTGVTTIAANKVTDERTYAVSDSRIDTLEAASHAAVTVLDGTGINFTLAGQQITAEPIFAGTGSAGTVAHSDHTHSALTVTVQEGDATVDAAVNTLDFDASDFAVTSSPAGEANIALAYGTTAGTPAEGNHTHAGNPTIFARQTKSSGFSAVTTALATLDSVEIGPGVNGVVYDIECEVHARLSVDATGYNRIYARIAGDSSAVGEETGTVAGERSCCATATKLAVTGDGSTTYTLAARADMDAGTGTCASTHIRGRMIPRS